MSPAEKTAQISGQEVKQCCAQLYESDVARLLLGDSFHPGGLRLTERLGQLLQLTPQSRVLDVASGRGVSAIFLGERFGCEVVGVDYSGQNVQQAGADAAAKNLSHRVSFYHADAESLPFPDGSFDAVICECAFCTFPEKLLAAREFARVLGRGGRLGLSDLTRGAALPDELNGLLAWIACIADAQPLEAYMTCFCAAGFSNCRTELHDEALLEMVRQVQGKLLGAEIMASLKKIDLPGLDFTSAKQMVKAALNAIQQGQLGYGIIIVEKPDGKNPVIGKSKPSSRQG
jgi:arsenite methyltransferase